MSKAIMISIKPKWVAKIMNGDKTIELRKNKALYKATMKLIEEQGYATFLMYCTKDGYLHLENNGEWSYSRNQKYTYIRTGKVVAKFTLRKVEEIYVGFGVKYQDGKIGITYDKFDYSLLKKACLTEDDLINYLKPRIYDEYDYYDTDFCAYHIEDLVIFDKPKELSEFHKIGKYCQYSKDIFSREWYCEWCKKPDCIGDELTKAPQNFCYVESEE